MVTATEAVVEIARHEAELARLRGLLPVLREEEARRSAAREHMAFRELETPARLNGRPVVLGACAGPWSATNALAQFSVAVGLIAEDGSVDLRVVLTVSAYKGKRVVTSVEGAIPEWAIRVVKEAYQVER